MAARLEALSDPMQITISQETSELIREEFICSELGEVEIKRFGPQPVYSLDGEHERGREPHPAPAERE